MNLAVVAASTGLISGTVGSEAIGAHAVIVTVTDNATPAQQAHTLFTWTITDVAAAVQYLTVQVVLLHFSV